MHLTMYDAISGINTGHIPPVAHTGPEGDDMF